MSANVFFDGENATKKYVESTYAPKASPEFTGSISMGRSSVSDVGQNSVAVGSGSLIASGAGSHAEGESSAARGVYSHAEGYNTKAWESASHAEGSNSSASGMYSHAEGNSTSAKGSGSHSEGESSTAQGSNSHAEGQQTKAKGLYAHAEGYKAEAVGDASHAEGESTKANGKNSHAGGLGTTAMGENSFVHGKYNVLDNLTPSSAQAPVQNVVYFVGNLVKYNSVVYECLVQHAYYAPTEFSDSSGFWKIYTGKYVEIVGNGTADSSRSNARTLDWKGNETLAGSLTLGSTTLTEAKLQQLLALLS